MNTFKTSLGAFAFVLTMLAPHVARAHHFKVDGLYKMDIRIGDRLFEDLVVLKDKGNHELEGTVTVPGIFTAKITRGSYGTLDFSGLERIKFEIEAIENGKPLKVLYLGFIDLDHKYLNRISFSGTAYDLDTQRAFGEFKAVPLDVARERIPHSAPQVAP